MRKTHVYTVQYFNPIDNEWHNIRGSQYDNEVEAQKRAKECERGFGETRVKHQVCLSTK